MGSAILAALYEGRADDARRLAREVAPSLAEGAALGDVDVCRARLASGASTEAPSPDGWRPLHLAAFFGHAAVVALLLASGASPSPLADSAQGNTPLHAALAGRYDDQVVRALLAAGADVNVADAHGVRPVHLAAARGYVAVLEQLVAAGARPGEAMPDGTRAVDLAEQRGHPEAVAWLRGRG